MQLLRVEDRPVLLPAQVRAGEGGGEAAVALDAAGQHEQVRCGRVDLAGDAVGESDRQLRAEHGGQAGLRGCGGEAGRTVETVVVRERQSGQPGRDRGLHELLRLRGTVEEAEVRVHVQFRVGRPRGDVPGWPGRLRWAVRWVAR